MVNSTHITICTIVIFGFFNLYTYIQNSQQKAMADLLKRSISKQKFLVKHDDNIVNRNEEMANISHILQQVKEIRVSDLSNRTLSLVKRIYSKLFLISPKSTDGIGEEQKKQSRSDEPDTDLEWLDRDDAKGYADYGDGSCPVTTDREPWQKVLARWIQLAKKYKIRYFLTAGSLLGAWRDQEVIPYDQDMDIRIHIDDFDKLYPLRQRKFVWDAYDDHDIHIYFTRDWRLPYGLRRRYTCRGKKVAEYEGQCSFTDPNARMIYRQWHMDIFAYTTYQDTVNFIPSSTYEYRKYDIFPLTRCMFMGLETKCPQKPNVIFKKLYSDLKPTKKCFNNTWVDV